MNNCRYRVGVDCYQFPLSGIGTGVDVTSAHLWLYKTRDVIGHHFADAIVSALNQTITVSLIRTPRRTEDGGSRGGNYRNTVLLRSVNVRRRSGCWVRINVHRAVLDRLRGWRRGRPGRPHRSLQVAVQCRGGCVLARGRRTAAAGGGDDRGPVLAVGTVETRQQRRRRTLRSTCPPSRCCLHRLYIDFARIGWTFIRQPPGYAINYCHGPCNCKLSHIMQPYVCLPLTFYSWEVKQPADSSASRIFSSAKEFMFSPASVCLLVC